MKNVFFLVAMLLTTNVFAKKCVEYFELGEDAYLGAVSLNKDANVYSREGNEHRQQGNLGVACGRYELAVNHYQASLILIGDATLEMWGAERNCLRRRDKKRAKENLALLERSSKSIKENMDKATDLFDSFCR